MASLDGIIAVPKGFKHDIRLLIVVAFMVAPIGVMATLAAVQADSRGTHAASSNVTAPAAPLQTTVPTLSSHPQTPLTPGDLPTSQSNQASSVELHTTLKNPGQPPVTHLNVNQQSVDVPVDGSVHKVISNGNGTTSIDVSNSSSTVSDSSSSSTSIQVNTSSSSSTNSQTSTGP